MDADVVVVLSDVSGSFALKEEREKMVSICLQPVFVSVSLNAAGHCGLPRCCGSQEEAWQ